MMTIPGVKSKQPQPQDPKRMPGAYLVTPEGQGDRSLYLVLEDSAEDLLLCECVNTGREMKLTVKEIDALAYVRGPRCPDFPDDL